ncbi:MAG: fumarylacetoacetate hydrolase family protein [Smithellaceae bacterium]|nr:fumarylacetoacetate hydrolase family protein [Syntrophaceae bacterium]MDD4242234.1 fumarylacetoacetate hydrolase family protein [Smithellaceae bacterium]NLX52996.1 fumarylacetoacetate hydrolase family protein [Deltaproteobacteria bacterium]
MKIIRFVSDADEILCGAYDPARPGSAAVIEGTIPGAWSVTAREARIKRLLAPLVPVNILALGINYKKHGDETAMSYPEEPVLFIKATSSLTGPAAPILLPAAGPDQVDYEAELAVVIGKPARNVTPEEALERVFGYTCANDVSARDWQFERQKGQWARGKSFDTFCPLGPWIVTRDEISAPNTLAIRCLLNGQVVQDAITADMIFDIPSLISHLSRSMTLLPGTVILTGTPDGVGFSRRPPLFLKKGDIVSVEIEKIGTLTNRIEKEF